MPIPHSIPGSKAGNKAISHVPGGEGISSRLTQKLGPLPVWMYGVGVGAAAIVYLKLHPSSSMSSAGTDATALDPTDTGTITGGVPGPAGPAGDPGTPGVAGTNGTNGKNGKSLPKEPKPKAGYTISWNGSKWVYIKNKGKTKPKSNPATNTSSVPLAGKAKPIKPAPNNAAPTLSNSQAGSVQIASIDTTPQSVKRVATGGGSHSAPVSLHPVAVTPPTGSYGGGNPTLVPRAPVTNPYRVPGRPSHHATR